MNDLPRRLDVDGPAGRTLRVHDDGEPGDTRIPVLVHHGTPQSGVLLPDALRDGRERGLRLIGFDRAGYGGSTRAPDRRVVDVVDDVRCLADALGLERFLTWGASGGGPHALAVAALMPDRVRAAAVLAGVAPYDAPDLDFLAGMGEDNVVEFRAAAAGAATLGPLLDDLRRVILASTPQSLIESMRSVLPPVDVAALSGSMGHWLHESMVRGLRPGRDGWLDDDLAFAAAWGFELAQVGVPVLVVAGGADLMVPFSHGRWLATQVPGAQAWLDAEAGHLTLLSGIGRVHDWLLRRA